MLPKIEWVKKTNTPEVESQLKKGSINHELTPDEINQIKEYLNYLILPRPGYSSNIRTNTPLGERWASMTGGSGLSAARANGVGIVSIDAIIKTACLYVGTNAQPAGSTLTITLFKYDIINKVEILTDCVFVVTSNDGTEKTFINDNLNIPIKKGELWGWKLVNTHSSSALINTLGVAIV
jgi:hypothetical protein